MWYTREFFVGEVDDFEESGLRFRQELPPFPLIARNYTLPSTPRTVKKADCIQLGQETTVVNHIEECVWDFSKCCSIYGERLMKDLGSFDSVALLH